jgi:Mg-chelatase subunit ChlD
VNASQFPSGFTIHACARAVNPAAYIDSSPVQSSVGANFTFADAGSGQIVFVIDASGSMDTAVGSTTRFRLVQDALIGAINRLCPSSRFGVVTFAGNILYSGGTWDYLTATAENKTMIVNEINRFKTDSGTNYEEALRVPGYFASRPSRVFFLTDGEPTGGGSFSDEVDALAASKVPVYTIGVDLRDTGRSRLADIAAATGGTATMVSTN